MVYLIILNNVLVAVSGLQVERGRHHEAAAEAHRREVLEVVVP